VTFCLLLEIRTVIVLPMCQTKRRPGAAPLIAVKDLLTLLSMKP
jgi:hypothetical protein